MRPVTRGPNRRKGQALIAAYLAITALLALAATISTKAISERNTAAHRQMHSQIFYLAEGGMEETLAAFASQIADYQISPETDTFSWNSTFAPFSNASVRSEITPIDSASSMISESDTNILVRRYLINSTVTHPDNPALTITIHQIFVRRLIPTFQHSVFYDQDLEMLPGPNMTLTGRIHSNQDIYLDSHNAFTINSTYLHSAGNIYNNRKDDSSVLGGDVYIRINATSPIQWAAMNNLDCDNANWTSAALARWNSTVMSSVHGVRRISAPSVASVQPGGYYDTAANVKIIDDNIYRGGVLLSEGTDYPAGTITANNTFYNNREGRRVRMTTIDLRKLAGFSSANATAADFPNNLPSNGLLFASRSSVPTGEQAGIRLANGSEIHRSGGLTVVTNDPLYIQGDYNTVNEKPTSVICDAVNLLSNSWSDTASTLTLTSRIPSATSVICAFIAGVDETTSGQYNGGLENYPRLHEKWDNRQLAIKGSFVSLWESQVATGSWVYGGTQYTAPTRSWQYNTAFNNPANLPPFTPWAVETRRIAWWVENS